LRLPRDIPVKIGDLLGMVRTNLLHSLVEILPCVQMPLDQCVSYPSGRDGSNLGLAGHFSIEAHTREAIPMHVTPVGK
jgi:hypothetical protein